MFKGLVALIRERFPLVQYGPMIAVFALANGLYFSFSQSESISRLNLVAVFFILLSSFFRLRLFDEIKDLETDLKINPKRPLARKVITVQQVKKTILTLIIFEVVVCLLLSPSVLLVHALAIGYSLLMFEEFFIGEYIRPHLTTYAVFHTFSSVLMGFTAAQGSIINPVSQINTSGLLFLLSNWMFFNIFEFARKTYGKSEERAGVDTYSSLFGIKGAVALTLSQVVLAMLLLKQSLGQHNMFYLYLISSVYVAISLVFVFSATTKMAKVFRGVSGLYLLLNYVTLAIILGKSLV